MTKEQAELLKAFADWLERYKWLVDGTDNDKRDWLVSEFGKDYAEAQGWRPLIGGTNL